MKQVKLITGTSNQELARRISANLGIPLADATVGRFSDGEIQVVINESVRDCDVFVVQSLCRPANENIMELLIIADALKRHLQEELPQLFPTTPTEGRTGKSTQETR
jgi:ribose-phosphate pyrophosphokinase